MIELRNDVVMDYNGGLLKVQVKTTRGLRKLSQRVSQLHAYQFNIKRLGKKNSKRATDETCHLYALVALDSKEIGYILNKEVKIIMNFRPSSMRGCYKDENTQRVITGTYLSDLTIDKVLCQILK